MTRVFRYRPPEQRSPEIVRPQVQSILAGRFDRRVTSVVAGAGFGKTTALVRALHENRLAPLGVDVWLACDDDDVNPDRFADGLAHAWTLAFDTTPRPAPEAVAESCALAAPLEICLVIDDAHLVGTTAGGRRWLDLLIDVLPANGHVLVAGREPVVDAPGPAAIVGEHELAFTDQQAADLRQRLGHDPDPPRAFAGWPALVELAARDEPTDAFLDEHVFDRVDSHAALVVDCLVAAQRADATLIAEVTGVDVDGVRHLPLVDRRGREYVAHALWHESRGHTPRVAELRVAVVERLVERGEMGRVVDLCISAREADESGARPAPDPAIWRRALLAAIASHDDLEPDDLRRWARGLSGSLAASGPGRFLVGLVGRMDRPAADETVDALTEAAADFRSSGDARSEALALSALTYPLHARADAAGLRTTYGRLIEMAAAGVGEATEQSRMAEAVIATATGNLEEVRSTTRHILDTASPGPTRTAALWMLCNARNGLGESSLETADELARSPARLPGMCAAPVTARWKLGMVRELAASPAVTVSGDRDRYVMGVWNGFLSMTLGDLDGAEAHLEVVRQAGRMDDPPAADGSDTFPFAALELERGEHDRARELMARFVATHPMDGPARGVYTMSVGLLYPHVPSVRPGLDDIEAGPLFRIERELARALTALVESDERKGVLTTVLPDGVGKLLCTFGLRHSVEYLSAAITLGVDRAEVLVEELVDLVGAPARTRLDELTTHANPTIAEGAARILSSVPVQPRGQVDVRLFGNASLETDGRASDDPNWRRERVRALFAFVVLHPTPTREIAMAELWPDMPTDAARRNLRTTINRLHQVLEPDRESGHAPFHLRSSGQLLTLHPGDRITVDVDRFTTELDEAARLEADGTPSLAIERSVRALDLYRGDLLPDSYDTWVRVRRDALRSRFVRAGVRCGELLSAAERSDEAIALLARVLGIEPYSEAAHRALIVAHLRRDDVAAARRAVETCESVLADVGGIADDATVMVVRRVGRRSA